MARPGGFKTTESRDLGDYIGVEHNQNHPSWFQTRKPKYSRISSSVSDPFPDPDPNGSALWKAFWQRIRIENSDPYPGDN